MISLRAYAKRRGVSAMAVSLAVKQGRLVKSVGRDANGQPKILDPDLADQEWDANTLPDRRPLTRDGVPLNNPAASAPPTGEPPTAQQRKLIAEAQLKELELATRRGQLVDMEEEQRRYDAQATAVKNKLLGVPSRAKQVDPDLSLAQLALVESLIREALEDLAS